MSQTQRIRLFGAVADRFFATTEWLAAPSGLPALGLKVAAAFTRLLVDQATARFEAVVDQPIGVLAAGYDVPGPRAVVDWFEHAPDPPELADQFAPEILAGEWRRLQDIHAIVHELHVVRRPLLRHVFAAELAAQDWRTIVREYPIVAAQVQRIAADPKVRSALKSWWSLLTGEGPERTDAEAQETLRAHWRGVRDLILDEFS